MFGAIWTEEEGICSGFQVGSWKLCKRKISFARVSSLRTVVLCIGSSQGYAPLIRVTIESMDGHLIEMPLYTESKPQIEQLRTLLAKVGRQCADAPTLAAVDYGPRMLLDGEDVFTDSG